MWIVIAAVVAGLVILVAVSVPVVGKVSGLRRAAVRLQRRQQEAMELQAGAERLEQTLLGLERRADTMAEHLSAVRGRAARPHGPARVGGRPARRAVVRRSSPDVPDAAAARQTHST
jgi:hypothetical protein